MNLAQDAQPQDGENRDQRGDAWLVYDGDCPFCSRYVQYLRLRQAAGPVRLVNAREGGPLVDDGAPTALALGVLCALPSAQVIAHNARFMPAPRRRARGDVRAGRELLRHGQA